MLRSALIATILLLTPAVTFAQQPAPKAATDGAQTIKRTPLQSFDVPGTNQTTVIARVDVMPDAQIGRHTHPGIESGYLLEGDMVLIVEGQADRTLKAGESYQIPAGAIHDGKSGAKGATVIATFVVEKGKPMASPAAPK
jgi:quercetin dioxygenase-like cupin family protein